MTQFRTRSSSEPAWLDDPLGFLVSPVTREQFFADYYEKRPLLSARSEPDRYADMLTLDALDAFVDSADLRSGMLDLASQQNRIEPNSFVTESGRIITGVVAEEYLKGATIIFPHLHESMAELGEFCRGLESVFSCHVQTNIYLTPQANPDGQVNQGFPIHYDSHDVFVLQISGSKNWRFYGAPVTTPYRGEAFQAGVHDPGEVTESFTLKPGDCVYVPPNTIHQHFNADPDRPVRLIVAVNRIYKHCGLNDLEQIENAPEYQPGLVLTPEVVERFLRVKQPA